MTSIRLFTCRDLFSFSNVNLDSLTETYHLSYYLRYLTQWPEYFEVAESPNGKIMGYIMSKAEGKEKAWHGHVSAVTVAPEFRRMGIAGKLMGRCEEISEKTYNCYYVDLFVRYSNALALQMYKKLGYIVYRHILDYYSDNNEDAFDMRKALARDVNKESVVPLKEPVNADDVEIF